MTQRLLIGTRKGTFIAERGPSGYQLRLSGHAGVSVNYVAANPHDGTLWAALGFGHWGAKLSMSKDSGQTWNDVPSQIKYPEGARYLAPPDPGQETDGPQRFTLRAATLLKLWVIGFGAPGSIYVGTIPGGLFVSNDGGERFERPRDVLGKDIDFEVDPVADRQARQRRHLQGVRDERHFEAGAGHRADRQADAVQRHRALLDQVGGQLAGHREGQLAVVAVLAPRWSLQVDRLGHRIDLEGAERGAEGGGQVVADQRRSLPVSMTRERRSLRGWSHVVRSRSSPDREGQSGRWHTG